LCIYENMYTCTWGLVLCRRCKVCLALQGVSLGFVECGFGCMYICACMDPCVRVYIDTYVYICRNVRACVGVSVHMLHRYVLLLPHESHRQSLTHFVFATQKYVATHCNALQHTATHRNTLQHTTTHCNTLQHTTTHCNTFD